MNGGVARFLTADNLARLRRVRHGFFTREGGVSEGIYASLNTGLGSRDDPSRVAENRRRARAALDARWLCGPHQVHSAHCLVVRDAQAFMSARPQADALATNVPGLMVAVGTADCTPVLFADARAGVVGAAHAGWKGALGGVLESTIARMEELGARRADIMAAIGPVIRQPSYEVGAEFRQRFLAEKEAYGHFFVPARRAGHFMFDLPGFVRLRLQHAGIGDITDLGMCTYAREDLFFSYRRSVHRGEPDYGRLMAGIVLTG